MLAKFLFAALCLCSTIAANRRDLENCDPSDKDEHCPPDPALASKVSFDFTSAEWNDDFTKFWSVDEDSNKDKGRVNFNTDGKGVALEIWKEAQAPTLTSQKYLFFGKVSVELQAAQGNGVVTAIVLKSDSGDEIDWEILGAYDKQAQTNYFYDGNALFNTYNDTYEIDSSVFSKFHTYSIEWTEQKLAFSIDGHEQKTWKLGEIPAEKWPQSPMHIKIGTWTVAKDSDEGEIAWAGGVPQWKESPFKAYYRKLEVEDYAGYCTEVDGPVEYSYDERTLGWEDVKISGCKKRVLSGGTYTPDVPKGDQGPNSSIVSGTGLPNHDSTTTGNAPAQTASSRPDGTQHGSAAATGDEAPPEETGDEEDSATKSPNMPCAAMVVFLATLLLLP